MSRQKVNSIRTQFARQLAASYWDEALYSAIAENDPDRLLDLVKNMKKDGEDPYQYINFEQDDDQENQDNSLARMIRERASYSPEWSLVLEELL